VKLNIGCGDRFMRDCLNVDLHRPKAVPHGVDFRIVDLEKAWPFPESSVETVIALDVIEHLHDKIFTMNECYRVLQPEGKFLVEVPSTDGPGAFQDPTHVSFWNRNSFRYYESGNPYRERFAASYGIRASFVILNDYLIETMDGPKVKILMRAAK
jgi:SAM-dependent methyltransferase